MDKKNTPNVKRIIIGDKEKIKAKKVENEKLQKDYNSLLENGNIDSYIEKNITDINSVKSYLKLLSKIIFKIYKK